MELDFLAHIAFVSTYNVMSVILMALGLSIIFGVMGVINMAHGEFMMLGAYTVAVGVSNGLPLWVSMVLAPIIVGLIGLAIERAIIRHLYGRILDTILATWGISLLMIQLIIVIFGTVFRSIATPLGSVSFGNYAVSEYNFVVMAITGLLMLGVFLSFSRTRFGIEAQAVAQLPETASALGVNSERVQMLTFAFGSALAGLAGALLSPTLGVVPQMGLTFVDRSFMGVIVGGQAIITGLSTAAAMLGVTQSVVGILTQPFIGQAAMLIVALVVLRILPIGVSGKWRRQL